MKCPTCEKDLLMTERSGIEIDYCPGCRGVWLDRGELDKFIEQASREQNRQESSSKNHQTHDNSRSYQHPEAYDDRQRYPSDQRAPYGQGYGKKRESFLSRLFDFD